MRALFAPRNLDGVASLPKCARSIRFEAAIMLEWRSSKPNSKVKVAIEESGEFWVVGSEVW